MKRVVGGGCWVLGVPVRRRGAFATTDHPHRQFGGVEHMKRVVGGGCRVLGVPVQHRGAFATTHHPQPITHNPAPGRKAAPQGNNFEKTGVQMMLSTGTANSDANL